IPFGSNNVKYQESLNGIQWTVVTVTILIACYMLLTLFRYWNADKAYALGSNLNKVGDYQQAYMKLKESVELRGSEPVFKDEFSSNNAVIGVALLQQKDATNAAGFIRDAIRLNDEIVIAYPNNLVFWKTRVRIFYMLSQVDPSYFPQALQSIQKAHELAPTDAKIAYNLGVIYGQSGDIKNAVRVLEEAKEMKPDYRDIYFALGLFYHELAKDGTETIVKPELQQKAVEALQYSLNHINNTDEQIKETLKSWNVTP
ncbi:MAG: hypothetical protein HY430_03475, partial [Candidatus Levybacteria bacterium]|nr:hypothetical protein [Candidatus Levybacteria bacterium]